MSEFNITINLDLNARVENKKQRKRKRVSTKRWNVQHGKQLGAKGKQKSSGIEGPRNGAAQSRQNGALTRHPSAAASAQPKRCPPHRTADASHAASPPLASTHSQGASTDVGISASVGSFRKATAAPAPAAIPSKYLAMDCEMVGTGPKGSVSQLGRCSVVSYEGDLVYDKFVKPPVPVTDFRTRWSGIRPRNLADATPYAVARKEILKLLAGKVVIGHAVHNDFRVLGYSHPPALTRDTSRIPLLNARAGLAATECASLKRLTKAIFNRDIQTGKKGHSSVEDARATMELYKVVEVEWEKQLASSSASALCQK